ncbi:unnamed protein product [Chironomus riparius]|uniref:Ionotropic receptor n=1 Tax=Chironomus riparius TaxID=315576 RepID=A0A9N9WRY1_9DIPT|nr:unnamed protein product [Chironomus riparius]
MHLYSIKLKILIFVVLLEVTRQAETSNTMLEVKDDSIKWVNLAERLVAMMLNSDVAQTKSPIHVLIFMMVNKETSSDFDGMAKAFSKASKERITFVFEILQFFPTKTMEYNRINIDMPFEFVILLMHSRITGYSYFINLNFHQIFPDKSLKLFLVMIGTQDVNMVFREWSTLILMGYFNVYVILYTHGKAYLILRTHLIRDKYKMKQSQDLKYLTIQKLSNNLRFEEIQAIYYDSYPLSYYRNGKIIGIEGLMIEEYSKKFKVPYKIINKHPEILSYQEASQYLLHAIADICLSTNINLFGRNYDRVLLNEMDGLCILTPRNIPISSYDNIALPLDSMSLIMSFVSTVSVIVSWKVISVYTANERSLKSVIVAVLEMIFNIGASGIEQITKKEVILLYSFIFSSLILILFYESLVLAFMFVSPAWRSAYDLAELNDSGAKFFTFYTRDIAIRSSIPFIREELIKNSVDLSRMKDLTVPKHFDENLVYLVSCKYADSFVSSTKNFHLNRRIFDKIKTTEMFQSYPIRKGYLFADEFKRFVESLIESGIYKYWLKESIQKSMFKSQQVKDESENQVLMEFPLILLFVGCILAFVVFLYENVIWRCMNARINQIEPIEDKLENQTARKKINLTMWMNKFIYKKTLDIPKYNPINQKRETIKSRESISGGYFVIKKIRKIRKAKQFRQIVHVRPCQENQ